jgi:diguanylate cyclase (GGDEF)-like protein
MLRLKNVQDTLLHRTRELDEANQQILRLNKVLSETNKQLQKKIYDLHNLFEISFKVMSETDLERLVNQALLHALGVFTAKSALLVLQDDDDKEVFSVKAAKGILKKKVEEFQLSRHDKFIHYLELIKKPFQISDVVREFQEIIPLLNDMEIRVVAPLFQNENIIGALCLGPNVRDEEYSPDVLELLGIVGNMLSVAIHNAQNFEKIKALSYTDGMTGLHNYRFFTLRLREEIARARRNQMPVSLLIMDVDYFKNYNDTLGHPAGDEVLRQLSAILKHTVRDNDIVARYGGEEFAIILPSTGGKGARALAERIRKKVEQHKFPNEEVQPGGTLTISIGGAIYPDDAVIMEDLIVAADRALYTAKAQGRNRVVFFHELEEK